MKVAPLRRMTEDDLLEAIVDLAKTLHWQAYHALPARTGRGYRTAMVGDVGFPDLVLAKRGHLVFAELKGHDARGTLGKPTPAQLRWLAELSGTGADEWEMDMQVTIDAEEGRTTVVALWSPEAYHRGAIERVLTEGRGDLT